MTGLKSMIIQELEFCFVHALLVKEKISIDIKGYKLMSSDLPKKGNIIFKTGTNMRQFAYIDGGTISDQFYKYITGYKSAADTLIKNAIISGQPEILDSFYYPTCFLLRIMLKLNTLYAKTEIKL
jgi:hypothetical protein